MTTLVHHELTGPLLKRVSRSFYLTLRVLPAPIRPQISIAYLLARATDTIADTEAVPRAKRVFLLRQLQTLSHLPDLGTIAEQQTTPGEKELLGRLDQCLDALNQFNEADCRHIQSLIQTIVTGQIFDIEHFPDGQLTTLANADELDRYTYLVAGCVGEFWTRMCAAHLAGMQHLSETDGIRFGKGLQLVNILRDMKADEKIGRRYLPAGEPYEKWLNIAAEHLDAGWRYTLSIPASQMRLRLACIWPIWIGVKTIALLRLSPGEKVKVPRGEVYRLMLSSLVSVRSNAALDQKYQRLKTGR
jgi:farnesyl-diphosphate farnesyltransferase